MAAIEASEAEIAGTLPDGVAIGAVNGPASVVVSGAAAEVDGVVEQWRARGRRVRRLRVSHAFHSGRMDAVLDELGEVAEDLGHTAPRVTWVGALTGAVVSVPEAGYWPAQAREAVRFADAVTTMAGLGVSVFVEIGPDETLSAMGSAALEGDAVFVPVLAPTLPAPEAVLTALARVHIQGRPVDWPAVLEPGRPVDLPTYAFRHQRFWPDLSASPAHATTEGTAAEEQFWAAVEGEDLAGLAGALEVDTDRPFSDVLPLLASWRRRDREEAAVAGWRYRVTWSPITEPEPARLSGTWLVAVPVPAGDQALSPQGGEGGRDHERVPAVADVAVRALRAAGAEVVVVEVGEVSREAVTALLAALLTEARAGTATPITGVLGLLALDESPLENSAEVRAGLAGSLALLQGLGDARIGAPVWLLTQQAVAATPDSSPNPVQSQVWGLGRSAAMEYPDRWGGLIDLPAVMDERAGARLAALLAADHVPGKPGKEDQVAIRPSGVLGRRLVRVPRPIGSPVGNSAVVTGTVLITGGTGALGGQLAGWLAERGAGRIVLLSRSGAGAAGIAQRVAGLADAGASIEVLAADVSRRESVAGVLAGIAAGGPALTQVMHTAGVLDDGVLDRMTPERLDHVLAVKAAGARHLDELTEELDAFVLFSSAAATFGGGGQGNYAAANAYLDTLAENRRSRGLPGTALAWGPWAGGGMAQSDRMVTERLGSGPFRALDPDRALQVLGQSLLDGDATLTVTDVDWAQIAAAVGDVRHAPFLRELTDVHALIPAAPAAPEATGTQELARRLSGLTAAEQEQVLTDVVRAEAAAILRHDSADAVEADRAFNELGFDSLTAIELRNRLSELAGVPLPSTLIFDYPTAAGLARHLRQELLGEDLVVSGAVPTRVVAPVDDDPIAIVGMGARYPGGVHSPDDLWQLLVSETDAISAFPADRGWGGPTAGVDADAQRGGFVHDAGYFDPGFFGISPREALAMDPQQRLLLETSWEALEQAGIRPASLRGSLTGVYAGGGPTGYGVGLEGSGSESFLMTGTAGAVFSGRVSYVLGLEGPSVTVDTACSSSLVAMHLAAQALRAGECDLALAGGVTVMATPMGFAEFSRQQGLAGDGRCKSFGAGADGTGWAEGAGIMVLERLSDARRNGHQVLAVLRGSAINQDGASNGLTAPNGPSQQRVIRAALANARLTTNDIDVVEAHGTGTVLGDPIEAQALLATYGQGRPEGHPLRLGSVKSNIAHTQAAAGAAGVMKMILAMRHGVIPATLHADQPSPHVDWTVGDISLQTEAQEWLSQGPRRAGVSAFGISGTNAHVIIEEAPPAESDEERFEVRPDAVLDGPPAWTLSGRSAEALAAQATRLAEHVRARPELTPADVAWSLAATRTTFDHRAVVLGTDRDELLAGLGSLSSGERSASVVSGAVRPGRAARVAFLFAGQGAQRAGMARELYAASPVFAAALDQVSALIEAEIGIPIREVLLAESEDARADQTLYAQTGLFAVEVALARMLAEAGIRPHAVAGHSVGEIAAAQVAGVLSLGDAVRLVSVRARLMQDLPEGGAMAAIAASEAEVAGSLPDGVSVAAVNGPSSVVVSGDEAAVERVMEEWKAKGRRVRRLRVSHAFHSARMEPVLAELADTAATLTHRRPEITWVGALTGEPVTAPEAGYWPAQARQAVRFADSVTALTGLGATMFIEIGPDGTLSAMGAGVLDGGQTDGAEFVPVLNPSRPVAGSVLSALGQAHGQGVPVDWTRVLPAGQRVDLPTYAFQRRLFWPDASLLDLMSVASADPGSAAEAQFWAAVEQGDLAGLTGALHLDGDRPFSEVLPVLASWRERDREQSAVSGWRYRIGWTAVTDPPTPAFDGDWLIVTGESGSAVAESLAEALTGRGGTPIRVEVGPDDTDRFALGARLAEIRSAEGEPLYPLGGPAPTLRAVISLLGLNEAALPLAPAVPAGLAATQGLVQVLGDAGVNAPLWVLTRSAVAAGAGETVSHPLQAATWGLGRVAALEYPDRWGGLVDLPENLTERVIHRLLPVLAGATGEDQLAIRGSGVLARRLTRAAQPDTTRAWSPRGTVLITGGTGAIGGRVARMAAQRNVTHVVLTSRSGPRAAGLAAMVAELAQIGTTTEVFACDTAVKAELAGVLARVEDLSTVFHAAGAEQGGPLAAGDAAELAAMLAPKAAGAAHLDELTAGLDLDAFVLFSSIAATWGSGHQSAYAAANAYLDGLAENRRGRGLAATSVAWGLWGGGGLGSRSGETGAQLERMGVRTMDPDRAIGALAAALDGGDRLVTVADIDWDRFAVVFGLRRPSRLIGDLPEVRRALAAAPSSGPDPADSALARQLATVTPAEQERILLRLVQTEAATVLGHDPASAAEVVQPGRAFRDLGFDSLTAVELRSRLGAATGLRLPATFAFDHPAPSDAVRYLRGELLGLGGQAIAETARTSSVDTDPIVIVGLGCRFPGGVRDPQEFWDLLVAGTDAVAGFPADRGWGVSDGAHAQGGFVYDAAAFDPEFFGISPREALAMDPQQRLLLEVSWEALERSGIDPGTLRGSRTGVFAGGSYSAYGLGSTDPGAAGFQLTGNATSVISGRVSYVLGLEGPAVTVDTACSSSLVALHLAAQSLRSGESDLALAGGVTVMATPGAFAEFAAQQGLASDGRCKSFADGADGTGWGEGAGVVVVERLSDARRNGHPVLAVVAATAINQDGASNGLTAPNGPAQQRVIRAALANAGLTAGDVDAVEAHGTGTVLGDPIEAQALLATYGQDRPENRPLWLGSVKSNIGHAQAAAGVAGIIKMVLALQNQQLPATLHVEEPSPQIDWNAGDVRLLSEPVAWAPGDRVRRAGVSGFGMSGTNAHLILEEAPAGSSALVAKELAVLAEPVPAWMLSGRTAAALNDQAVRLRSWAGPSTDLNDVAWSLATGRAAFEHRAVVLGEDLVAGLTALSEGSSTVVSGVADGRPRVGFLFAGQGAQRGGMGRELYAASPVFAQAFDEAMLVLEAEIGPELRDLVLGTPDDPRADQTVYAQAGLFAVEVGLLAVLKAAGVTPDVVAGHSVGEIAAAHAAGVLSLTDAAALVAARGRLMQALPDGGAMAALEASEAEVEATLFGGVWIAAVNGPSSVVVSGDAEAVEALLELWRAQDRRVRRLRVSHAFHSARMDPMLSELSTVASGFGHSAPTLTWVGALTGEVVTAPSAGYWPAQARQAVRFGDTVQAMRDAGVTVFVEIGPDGTLSGMGASLLDDALFVPTRRESQSVVDGLLGALARVYTKGVEVDWRRVLPAGRRLDLPTYAFQHERFWVEATAAPESDREFWSAVEEGDAQALGLDDATQLDAILPLLTSWRRRRADRSVTDGWRYRIAWESVAGLNGSPEKPLAGSWLLVSGPRESGTAYGERIGAVERVLSEGGAEVFGVTVTSEDDRPAMAGKLADALTGAPAGVLWLPPNDLLPSVRLVQALGDASVAAPLWVLTQGAVADPLPDPDQAAIWGFGRVVGLEHPERWGGLIDLPADTVPAQLCAVLVSGVEDQVALRGEDVLARRLVHAGPVRKSDEQWTPAGPVLITGGSGSLGSRVARWVVGRGAESIVLTSRSGALASGVASVAAEIALSGSGVSVLSADIGERDDVAGLLDWVADHDAPVDSVFHVAGRPEAIAVEAVDADGLRRVTSAKADGALWLDQLTSSLRLSAFVVFSSISATWGSGHQPGYAAANAYLDALVENRRGRGLAGTSLAWGPWSGGGMGALGEAETAFRSRGLRYLDGDRALAVLGSALDAGESSLTVADVDWERFAGVFTLRRASALLTGLPEVLTALADADDVTVEGSDLAARLEGRSRTEQDRILTTLVRTEAAAVLGYPSIEPVGASRAFKDLGFDSLTAVELRNRVVTATGQRLAATVVFDYPTPADLAAHLRELVRPDERAVPMLAELDSLEARLADIPQDSGIRADVTVRLQTLLSNWIGARDASASAAASAGHAAERLETADADAVFDFIDRELGVTPLDGHLDGHLDGQ